MIALGVKDLVEINARNGHRHHGVTDGDLTYRIARGLDLAQMDIHALLADRERLVEQLTEAQRLLDAASKRSNN